VQIYIGCLLLATKCGIITFSIGGPNGCTNANKDLYISDCGNSLEAARGPLKFQINTKIINYAIATYIRDLSYSFSLICLSLDM
jgi:hypothetical protein